MTNIAIKLTPDAKPVALEQSYLHCIQITKERAKNFHFAFSVLPKERYRGICALYAFSRLADDLSDDETDARKSLEGLQAWRKAFDDALTGQSGAHEILPALADTMKRYAIPPMYMHELINGTEMDTHKKRYQSWDETYLYCYRVASVIGMMTVHVFGFTDPAAIPLAEKMGIAFQMTNILRDLKEDAGRDRIYLPLEDLRVHGVSEGELLAAQDTPAIRRLVKSQVERTRRYYDSGFGVIPLIEPESRDALGSLVAIYQSLLEKIAQRDYNVLAERVSLSKAEKLKLAAGFAWRAFFQRGS